VRLRSVPQRDRYGTVRSDCRVEGADQADPYVALIQVEALRTT
jgi:hypothetical protein